MNESVLPHLNPEMSVLHTDEYLEASEIRPMTINSSHNC
jgi:hypothetical protein